MRHLPSSVKFGRLPPCNTAALAQIIAYQPLSGNPIFIYRKSQRACGLLYQIAITRQVGYRTNLLRFSKNVDFQVQKCYIIEKEQPPTKWLASSYAYNKPTCIRQDYKVGLFIFACCSYQYRKATQ